MPETPLNLLRLGELISETDIPPGVVNTITSSDHLVGETLASSADVDLVAFTGSTETRKRVMQTAAANVTRCFLGLGGSVTGGDPDRATAIARRIRTGTISVNGTGGYDPAMPFGGHKQSGIGRQWGVEGFDELMELTSISMPEPE